MLQLLANIFQKFEKADDALPEALIEAATERVIDGTDPRLRIDSGYARRLRKPVIHAVHHVVQLVESLPAPEIVSPQHLPAQPDLAAMLYSGDRMRRILREDAAIADVCKSGSRPEAAVFALLVVKATDKRGFGTALVKGESRAEVARTTVNFSEHQLVDPSIRFEETEQQLKRRAFDALLTCALALISEQQEERSSLVQRRALLQAKLDIVRRSGGFVDQRAASEQGQAQRQLEQIEQQLEAMGEDEDVLANNLDTIAQVLQQAEQHLWVEPAPMALDRFYVLHPPGGEAAEIPFLAICASTGERRLLRLLGIDPAALP